MRKRLLLFFILFGFCSSVSIAQKNDSTAFEFRYAPTSTDDYKIIIKSTSVELIKRELLLKRNRDQGKIRKTYYIHQFSIDEMKQLDSIITKNKLDSVDLYNTKSMKWGLVWKVKIFQHSVPHEIDLPNYHNIGLEALLVFVNDIIPDKEKSKYGYIATGNFIKDE